MGKSFHTCPAWILIAAVTAIGCGRRTGLDAEADLGAIGPDGGVVRACGFGPPCDPDDLGTRTCESLGLGSGTLGCNATTCNLDISRCGAPTGGRTGVGTPGTSGTGGVPPLFGGSAGSGAPGFFGTGTAGTGFFGGQAGTGFFGGQAGTGFFGGQAGQGDDDEDGGTDPGGGFFGGNPGGFFGGTNPGGGIFGGGNNPGGGFFGGQ